MKASYDLLARYYDRLSHLVYGNAIVDAHRFLINHIPASSSVLIVGGGTGFILEEIAQLHSKAIDITYIENSVEMLALSRERNCGNNKITFINASVVDVVLEKTFAVVITPFFIDNFSLPTAALVFEKLHKSIQPAGLWLFADFAIDATESWWQKPLLKIMYLFFHLVCGIEAKTLPDTEVFFKQYNYKKMASKVFFKRFIVAEVYTSLA